ncbi:MAG: hypothetical protein M3237_18185 [Actinomycetota bacterium]|nr:hypothetical protein [Actinomycetota bacterium]
MTTNQIADALEQVSAAIEVPGVDEVAFHRGVAAERRRRRTLLAAVAGAAAAVLVAGAVALTSLTDDDGSVVEPAPVPDADTTSWARWSHAEVELSSTVVTGTGAVPPLTDAERQDLTTFAKQEGYDVDEFIAEQRGQGEFGVAVGDLAERYGADLAAGWAADGNPAWVVLPEEPDAGALEVLAGLSGDTEVLWGETPPIADFDRVGPGIYDAAQQATGRMLTFTSGPNSHRTRLHLTYNTTDRKPLTGAEIEAAVREVAGTYPDGLLPMPVDLIFDPAMKEIRTFG